MTAEDFHATKDFKAFKTSVVTFACILFNMIHNECQLIIESSLSLKIILKP